MIANASHVRIANDRPAQPSPKKIYNHLSHCILTYRPGGACEAMRCH